MVSIECPCCGRATKIKEIGRGVMITCKCGCTTLYFDKNEFTNRWKYSNVKELAKSNAWEKEGEEHQVTKKGYELLTYKETKDCEFLAYKTTEAKGDKQ